jgi:hypothetical protein
MTCCGQGRTPRDGLRSPGAGTGAATGETTRWATTHVRYLKEDELDVIGPESHCRYRFSGLQDAQPVYRIDLPHLLRSGLFEPA